MQCFEGKLELFDTPFSAQYPQSIVKVKKKIMQGKMPRKKLCKEEGKEKAIHAERGPIVTFI